MHNNICFITKASVSISNSNFSEMLDYVLTKNIPIFIFNREYKGHLVMYITIHTILYCMFYFKNQENELAILKRENI